MSPTRRAGSRPRFSSGKRTSAFKETLLTASMSEVFLRLGDPVLAGDSALRKGDAESMLVESRQTRTLSQRQPAVPVEPARQFDLHRQLALSKTQWEAVQDLLIQFKGDPHVSKLATAPLTDKAGPGLNSTPGATDFAHVVHGAERGWGVAPQQDRLPGANHAVEPRTE